MNSDKTFLSWIMDSADNNHPFIPRMITGLVFLSEGIQKFLYPELLGTGRFVKTGFPDPSFWATFTGIFEIICGLCLLMGFLSRLAAIPLFIIMLTAFITTKWPVLITDGFWKMAHEYRTDFAMTLLLIYLLIYGAGKWSLDSIICKSHKTKNDESDKNEQ